MTRLRAAGPRWALWWNDTITRGAPTAVRAERRAEILSDVFEQVGASCPTRQASRAVLGRALRGVPSDLAWRLAVELAPDRRAWHRQHPSTALAGMFLVSIPLGLLADAAQRRLPVLTPYVAGLWLLVLAASWTLLGFAGLASLHRLQGGNVTDPEHRRPRVVLLRRCLVNVMAVSWAGSAVWRYAPVEILSGLSTAAWALFGLSLAAYVLMMVLRTLLRLGSYLPMLWTWLISHPPTPSA